MDLSNRNFSIVLFPWLAHSHVFSYFELAKNLSKKNFKIYFISTSTNLSSIKDSQLEKTSNIHLVEPHLPLFPDLPPHYQTTKNMPYHLFPRLCKAFHMSKSNFFEILIDLKPDLVIYDLCQTWAPILASSLGIPAIHFATIGASAYSFIYHHLTLKDLDFPYQEIYLNDRERKVLDAIDMSVIMDKEDDCKELGAFPFMKRSHELVLMKSCMEIEGKYMNYLSQLIKKKIVPIGSLVIHDHQTTTRDNVLDKMIVEWLSKKKENSTVFISFGSENCLPKNQIEEMALGLELICDQVNFLWMVRLPPGDEAMTLREALPMGFLDRVGDRGIVVEGWAPQNKILEHPSVGAFVSHCGMSSTLESIYFGVPVVTMPFIFDQPLNARLLLAEGVGVEVERGENNGWFRREAVAKAIKEAILGKSGEEMRLKAKELSIKMKNEDEHAMDRTVEHIHQLCVKYYNLHYNE